MYFFLLSVALEASLPRAWALLPSLWLRVVMQQKYIHIRKFDLSCSSKARKGGLPPLLHVHRLGSVEKLAKLLCLWTEEQKEILPTLDGGSRISLCRKVSCPYYMCNEQLPVDNKGLTGCDLPRKHTQRQYWGANSWTINIFSAFLHSSALLLCCQSLQRNFSHWSFWKMSVCWGRRVIRCQCFLHQSCWEFLSIALATRKLWSFLVFCCHLWVFLK